MEAARVHLDKAGEWYKKALAAAEELDAKRAQEQEGGAAAAAAAAGAAGGEAGGATLSAQAMIMEGNVLYEWSQLLATAGADWRGALDTAVERFKGASCSEADVRNALKNHTQAAELDLGPEPEPEAPASSAAESAAESVPAGSEVQRPAAATAAAPVVKDQAKAKGLPSLEVKRKPAA